ncbi:MAG: hypothetical protein R2753_07730 [Chitinophagales bacterium]
MNGVKNLVELFPNYLNIQSNIDFLKYLLNDYYALPIGLLLILIYYWKNKSYKKILLVTISFFFYLFIINISYPNGGDQFYIENLYLPLSIFIIFPLVYEVLPSYNRKVSLFIFIAIVLSSITRIYYNHESYTERLNWMRNYMELTKGADNKKQFIDAENVPTNVLIMTWATPYEFWLLSTIELNYTRSILIDKNLENHSWMLLYNKKFATKWGAFNYSELPTKYFKLTDTTHYSLENLLIINN